MYLSTTKFNCDKNIAVHPVETLKVVVASELFTEKPTEDGVSR